MTKMYKVEVDVEGAKKEDAEYWVEEIANQYADLVVENVSVSSNKISFSVGSPSMDDIPVADIKFRIDEYNTMNEPPFKLKSVHVG